MAFPVFVPGADINIGDLIASGIPSLPPDLAVPLNLAAVTSVSLQLQVGSSMVPSLLKSEARKAISQFFVRGLKKRIGHSRAKSTESVAEAWIKTFAIKDDHDKKTIQNLDIWLQGSPNPPLPEHMLVTKSKEGYQAIAAFVVCYGSSACIFESPEYETIGRPSWKLVAMKPLINAFEIIMTELSAYGIAAASPAISGYSITPEAAKIGVKYMYHHLYYWMSLMYRNFNRNNNYLIESGQFLKDIKKILPKVIELLKVGSNYRVSSLDWMLSKLSGEEAKQTFWKDLKLQNPFSKEYDDNQWLLQFPYKEKKDGYEVYPYNPHKDETNYYWSPSSTKVFETLCALHEMPPNSKRWIFLIPLQTFEGWSRMRAQPEVEFLAFWDETKFWLQMATGAESVHLYKASGKHDVLVLYGNDLHNYEACLKSYKHVCRYVHVKYVTFSPQNTFKDNVTLTNFEEYLANAGKFLTVAPWAQESSSIQPPQFKSSQGNKWKWVLGATAAIAMSSYAALQLAPAVASTISPAIPAAVSEPVTSAVSTVATGLTSLSSAVTYPVLSTILRYGQDGTFSSTFSIPNVTETNSMTYTVSVKKYSNQVFPTISYGNTTYLFESFTAKTLVAGLDGLFDDQLALEGMTNITGQTETSSDARENYGFTEEGLSIVVRTIDILSSSNFSGTEAAVQQAVSEVVYPWISGVFKTPGATHDLSKIKLRDIDDSLETQYAREGEPKNDHWSSLVHFSGLFCNFDIADGFHTDVHEGQATYDYRVSQPLQINENTVFMLKEHLTTDTEEARYNYFNTRSLNNVFETFVAVKHDDGWHEYTPKDLTRDSNEHIAIHQEASDSPVELLTLKTPTFTNIDAEIFSDGAIVFEDTNNSSNTVNVTRDNVIDAINSLPLSPEEAGGDQTIEEPEVERGVDEEAGGDQEIEEPEVEDEVGGQQTGNEEEADAEGPVVPDDDDDATVVGEQVADIFDLNDIEGTTEAPAVTESNTGNLESLGAKFRIGLKNTYVKVDKILMEFCGDEDTCTLEKFKTVYNLIANQRNWLLTENYDNEAVQVFQAAGGKDGTIRRDRLSGWLTTPTISPAGTPETNPLAGAELIRMPTGEAFKGWEQRHIGKWTKSLAGPAETRRTLTNVLDSLCSLNGGMQCPQSTISATLKGFISSQAILTPDAYNSDLTAAGHFARHFAPVEDNTLPVSRQVLAVALKYPWNGQDSPFKGEQDTFRARIGIRYNFEIEMIQLSTKRQFPNKTLEQAAIALYDDIHSGNQDALTNIVSFVEDALTTFVAYGLESVKDAPPENFVELLRYNGGAALYEA